MSMNRRLAFAALLCAVFILAVFSYAADQGKFIDARGRVNVPYLRQEGDSWSRWYTDDQGRRQPVSGAVSASELPPPMADPQAFSNSGYYLAYSAAPTGSWPEAVAIGDVNNDSRKDVVLVTSRYFDEENDHCLFVYLQDQNGNLATPVKYKATWNPEYGSVDIGDVNGDGRNDVVAGGSSSGVEVYLQNSSGTLNTPIIYPFASLDQIKIGDLNGDGRMDIVGVPWSDAVKVWLQKTDGTLNTPVSYTVGQQGYNDVDIGDVNDDGRQDLIVMSGQGLGSPISVLLQNGSGTLNAPVKYSLPETIWDLPGGMAVGDVNHDFRADVVVSYGGNSPNAWVAVFAQKAGGTLDPPVSYVAYDCPEPVVLSDANLDGRKDVLVAHGGWNAIGLFQQAPGGYLQGYELYDVPYASHYQPQGIAVGDINGDGAEDIVIADYNHGLVTLLHEPDYALYLRDGRFRVQVQWWAGGSSGLGRPVPLSNDSGYFYFFGASNVEIVVKILDGRGVNGRFWVFYGALTDVRYILTVTDMQTGAVKGYENPAGVQAGRNDTNAFTDTGASPPGEDPQVDPGLVAQVAGPDLNLCSNRFRVNVTWYVGEASGEGTAVPLTGDSGYFYFFGPGNVELIVKVLDGRGTNGHFWVFYGALTDVAYVLSITDTQTGAVKWYMGQQGVQKSGNDINAF